MYITYSQKCVFSRNHTIKKKKTSKKGGGKWISPTFQPKKPQKSTQRHPGEDHAPGRDHIARTLGRSTAPSGTRGGDWAETDRVQNSKRRKFRSLEKAKKKNFLGRFLLFWSFWGWFVFPRFSKPLIVFGYGCIWLFSFQLLVVWPCFCAVSTGLRPRRDLLHRLPFGHLRRLAENLQLSTILLDEGEQRWIMVNRRNCSNEHYWAQLFKETVFVLEVGEKNEMPQMPQMSTKPRLVD